MSGAASPRAFQRLLRDSPWQHQCVIDALHDAVAPYLNGDDGIWVLEDIGFSKRGTQSVGVVRQHNPTLGKRDNCQVGVFLRYASARGQAFVDTRLYLPQSWIKNRPRCQAAGVPDTVSYQSHADLALNMLRDAAERRHLQSHWVTGGRTFGRNTTFRDGLDAGGWWYVLEVPLSMGVVAGSVVIGERVWAPGSRMAGSVTTSAAAPRVQMIGTLAAQLPLTAWHEDSSAAGTDPSPAYRYAVMRVRDYRTGTLGTECWLLLRRKIDGTDVVAYLSNVPDALTPELLEQVQARQGARPNNRLAQHNAIGLVGYETRSWQGWHHHMTLCLLADAFLLRLQHAER
jgi:SRSO17 transposase